MQSVLAGTANPEAPNEVDVSQPSQALVAQADAKAALNYALPRPGSGVAAGRRRRRRQHHGHLACSSAVPRSACAEPLGATKGHIRVQFMAEAVLLSLLGGVVGVAGGAVSTAIYAATKRLAGRRARRSPGAVASGPPF